MKEKPHQSKVVPQTIGIPRGLLYYRYGDLWRDFLERLGHMVVVSPPTDQSILSIGSKYAIDEACLPFKIYLGHVDSLHGACDAILIPHVEKMGGKTEACLRFQGLYDMVQNTFRTLPLLPYDLNAKHLPAEPLAFMKLGHDLRHPPYRSLSAYRYARSLHLLRQKKLASQQNSRLQTSNPLRPKILILAQSYLIHDALLGNSIRRTLKELDADIIFADHFDPPTCAKMSRQLSKDLYWVASQELVGALALAHHFVDGIITVTAFPCGADAMVNELLMRRTNSFGVHQVTAKAPPLINLVIDDLDGDAGVETRIESFLDIIRSRTTTKVIAKQVANA